MNAREQLLQRQKSVLEEALLRQLVMCEWAESVACAFAFDLGRGTDPALAFSEGLAVARGEASGKPKAMGYGCNGTDKDHHFDHGNDDGDGRKYSLCAWCGFRDYDDE